MFVGVGKIFLYAEWSCSLKDKRAVVKSLIDRIKNKFNVSVAEIENLDMHKSIVIGIACISNSPNHSRECIEKVIDFIENNTDAVLEKIEMEIL